MLGVMQASDACCDFSLLKMSRAFSVMDMGAL